MSEPEPVRHISTTLPGDVDPDADLEAAGVTGTTALEDVRDELGGAPERLPVVRLKVPTRPGYELVFDPNVEDEKLAKWNKASADRHYPDNFNNLAFACRLLASQHIATIRNGEELQTQGEPLTVRHSALLDILGEGRPTEAIRKLYGADGHVVNAATEVIQAAGYGDNLAEAGDPTRRG